MRHNFIDRFANLESALHTLEARSKILGFAALIVAVLMIEAGENATFFAYFLAAAVLTGISRIPLGYVLARTAGIAPFFVLAGISSRWAGDHDIGWLAALLLRSVLCLILLVILTNTTPFTDLLHGLRRLGVPRILVVNLSFLYRYLFVLTEEVMRMRLARDCRRAGRASPGFELRLLGSMLGTLLLRSFERAERMYQAMLSRGYSGEFPVVSPRRFAWRDAGFLLGVILFVIVSFKLP